MPLSKEITVVYHNPNTGIALVNVSYGTMEELREAINKIAKKKSPKKQLMIVYFDGVPDHSITVE